MWQARVAVVVTMIAINYAIVFGVSVKGEVEVQIP